MSAIYGKRSLLGKLGKNTFYVGAGQFVHLALAFILTPVAARALGDADFGRYALASTLMFFVFLLNDLGLNTWITREAAQRHGSEATSLIRNALGLKLSLALPLLGVVVLTLAVLRVPTVTAKAIAIFGLYGVLSSLWQLGIAVFRASEVMKYEPVVYMLEKALITLGAIVVFISGYGLIPFVAIFPLAGFVSLGYVCWLLRRFFPGLRPQFDFRDWPSMIRHSFPFGFSVFLATVYNKVDVILLSMMTSAAVVGWYSAAYKLLTITNLVPTVVATATFPRFASLQVQDKTHLSILFSQGIRLLLALCVPMIALVSFYARPLTLLFFGSEYEATAPAIQILAWAAGIVFFNIYLAGFLGAIGLQSRVVRVQMLGTALNIVANIALIPSWQHLGAAVATVLTEGLILVLLARMATQQIVTLSGFKLGLPLMAGAAGLVVFLGFAHVRFPDSLLTFPLACLAYAAPFFAFGGRRAFALLTS